MCCINILEVILHFINKLSNQIINQSIRYTTGVISLYDRYEDDIFRDRKDSVDSE